MSGWGLKLLVLVTGAIAGVVWLVPSLVTIGLFLLILPGLILMIMPTLFVYLLAALLIRSVLPFQGWLPTVLALGAAVALGFILPQPLRLIQTAQYKAALEPDIVPAAPLKLTGHILVLRHRPDNYQPSDPRCEALCAALLTTPGVTGVTLRDTFEGGDVTREKHFRLDPAAAGRTGAKGPVDPQSIVGHLPEFNIQEKDGKRFSERSEWRRALEGAVKSDWTIRLATQAGLVETAHTPPPAWTITLTEGQGGKWKPRVDRLEVARAKGAPLLRTSVVAQKRIAVPFHFGFEGGIENAHFAVGYSVLRTAPAYPGHDPEQDLLKHTSLRQAVPDTAQSGALRAAVVAALDGPAISPAQAELVRGWMDGLDYRPAPGDLALVHRIIADQRIVGIEKQVRRFYAKAIPAELRGALGARILNPISSPEERERYAFLLSKLPEGAFAVPSADEARIFADSALLREAAPLIERLADRGQPALGQLMTILETEIASGRQWYQQRPVIRSVRRSLARLGPAAASALPRIRQLFGQQRNPLANEWREAVEWRIVMARMGLPIDELPFPPDQKPEVLERDKAEIRKRLDEFDPAWESGYSY